MTDMFPIPTRGRDHKGWLAYWQQQLAQAESRLAAGLPTPAAMAFQARFIEQCRESIRLRLLALKGRK